MFESTLGLFRSPRCEVHLVWAARTAGPVSPAQRCGLRAWAERTSWNIIAVNVRTRGQDKDPRPRAATAAMSISAWFGMAGAAKGMLQGSGRFRHSSRRSPAARPCATHGGLLSTAFRHLRRCPRPALANQPGLLQGAGPNRPHGGRRRRRGSAAPAGPAAPATRARGVRRNADAECGLGKPTLIVDSESGLGKLTRKGERKADGRCAHEDSKGRGSRVTAGRAEAYPGRNRPG